MKTAYPDASVQALTGAWWEEDERATPDRGRLVRAITPYPDQKPFRIVPVGRGENPRQHDQARYLIEEFRVGQAMPDVSRLPVAGLPLREGETYLARRGKLRPCVVVATVGTPVERALTRGAAGWQSRPAVLLVPCYGVEAGRARGGWNHEFVARIQRAEYSQYVWDALPVGGSSGSILRLDHLFPLGSDPANWRSTEHRLGSDAMRILDEWLEWRITGTLAEDGVLNWARRELAKV